LKKNLNKKIGILGGTFDPAHIGHIKISKVAKKKFKLNKIIWAITNKNPFKKKTKLNLLERMRYAKKINLKNKFIKVVFFEKKIKSKKTIDLINFIKKSENTKNIYFIMGADNLINFHKWYKWRDIMNNCNILVFDRKGYKLKSRKSLAFKKFNNKGLFFISFKKVNISSSQLRKI
tara:strand:+ start:212 stop:739 length:528 start_codon:yes stop_codon:yes gene_type:complete